jgi:hypothetical protein
MPGTTAVDHKPTPPIVLDAGKVAGRRATVAPRAFPDAGQGRAACASGT